MTRIRPYTQAIDRLKAAKLRPTRQRIALARLLLDGEDRHVTAEQLHAEALDANVRVSLATVYNSLHQFTAAGLMREVVVETGRSYFDTNTSDHYHFFEEDTATLSDIPTDSIELTALPQAPEGRIIDRVDIIVRLK
ncbi:MAG: transcriptional repressor [Rhodospirillaceae bacterium]|jgi:Fur family transcriptional regulator, iron response regulator|nr:transcriptional repressor [Rhodospirillaceae bacterium]MBT5664217.1 transcriptional repressor [Rhodospirillaceae bacterium]MBT5810740.1 transcriptional repressor [Rhodospirillaceae bacterium]